MLRQRMNILFPFANANHLAEGHGLPKFGQAVGHGTDAIAVPDPSTVAVRPSLSECLGVVADHLVELSALLIAIGIGRHDARGLMTVAGGWRRAGVVLHATVAVTAEPVRIGLTVWLYW